MSQANWIEWFREQPVERERPKPFWQRLPPWVYTELQWDAWLTFGLVMMTFLSVAHSIEAAHWVAGMPSIMLVSFLALLTGFLFSRIRVHEVFLHLLAFLTGVPIVVGLVLSYMGETALGPGLAHFWSRFGDWIDVVRNGGITSDNMPFVTIVLALAWIASYLSAWAIFRWRNAWIALIPGGIGLLTNISYLPGQFSADFVVFLFGAMLLVMRVNLLNREHDWQRRGIVAPRYLTLTLLNATVWISLALLIVSWRVPLAGESRTLSSAWNTLVSPFSNASADWSRLFSSIDAKKEVPLHSFGPTLPLQGKVVLSDRVVAEVDFGDQSNEGRNLVAARYDEYTPDGWIRGPRLESDISQSGVRISDTQSVNSDIYKERKDVPVDVVVDTPDGVLLTIGQPLQSSIDGRADLIVAGQAVDVGAIRPKKDLKRGDQYTTVGSISVASEDELRKAGADYPDYVKTRYLQLPATLPQRVRDLAVQLTAGQSNAYDAAQAIESYLRQLPATYDIPIVPPGRDAVDYFLFDTKKGYSDYQASAMVVLLRAVGIPARLATGYAVQEFDLNTHRYVVREKDAESWPEVYFPQYGWVEFSPFGAAPLVSRPFSGATAQDQQPDNPALSGDFPGIFDNPGLDPDFPLLPDAAGGSFTLHQPFNWLPVYIGLTFLAVLILTGGVLRVAWEIGLRGLDPPSRTWEKTQRLARWLRIPMRDSQTPNEFAAAIARRTGLEEEPRTVARAYLWTRYGHKPLAKQEETALNRAWVRLRNRLFKRLVRMK
jgi:transglutaminase-like putative cysteine protease